MESAAAAPESSILPGNNQSTDPNRIRSDTEVRAPGELPPPAVAEAVGGKEKETATEKDCTGIVKVDTYHKRREEGQWCNNKQVEGQFGNLVKVVHGERVSTGSSRLDDRKDGGGRKF